MRRKIVRHGSNTLTVSLPAKWAKANNVKNGDEIEVEENGNGLGIYVGGPVCGASITIDTRNLDQTTLKYFLRFSYRNGYDEILISYKDNQNIPHFRTSQERDVISIINEELTQFMGMDIIEQNDKFTRIRSILKEEDSEFYSTFRRVFYILGEGFGDFSKLILTKQDKYLFYLKQRHDLATKSLNYLLRVLNKIRNYSDEKKKVNFITLYYLESIFDLLEHFSLYPPDLTNVNSKNFKDIFVKMESYMNLFMSTYFKFNPGDSIELQKNRNIIESEIRENKRKLTGEEGRIAGIIESILNIFRGLIALRICSKPSEINTNRLI